MSRRRATFAVTLVALVGCAEPERRHEDPPPPRPEDVLRDRARGAAPETAARPTAEHGALSPDQLAFLAIEQNPRLRAVRSRWGVAGAELVAAGLISNPRLAVALGGPTGGDEGRVMSFDVEVAWDLTPLFARSERQESAGEALASVDLEVAWQEWQVAQAARLSAAQVSFLLRRVEAAAAIARTWEERLVALERGRALGVTTALDVAAAQKERDATRLRTLELQRDLIRARAGLAGALGVTDGSSIDVDPQWSAPRDRPHLGDLLERLPRRRLDLIALEHGRRSHDAALRAELARRFPSLEVRFFTNREPDRVWTTGAGIEMGLPLFDRNQARILRESETVRQAELGAAAALAEARGEITRLVQDLRVVEEQLDAAAAATASARRVAALAVEAARTGALSGLAATQARAEADQAGLRQLELEQAAAELRCVLDAAAGL